MATQKIRVEFICEEPKILKFTHDIPSSLVDNAKAVAPKQDSEYLKTFAAAIKTIFAEHYGAAFQAAYPLCSNCRAPKFVIKGIPISDLHNASDPHISILVVPICNKEICAEMATRNAEKWMSKQSGQNAKMDTTSAIFSKNVREVGACLVCHTTVKTSRCAGCGDAFYCGKEHQRMDWHDHKPTCKKIAREKKA